MEIKIIKADYETALVANKFLTKLISDEKKYDDNINEHCIVKSLYEKFYNEESVCLLIANYENNAVGYIYGYVQDNGDAKKDVVCVLDALYVLEEYRKKGIGSGLISEFKKWVKRKNAKYIELKVCNENKEAIKLYESFGFITNKFIMNCKVGE